MKTTTLWESIDDARMAVHYGQQELTVHDGVTHVRVWRESAGIEGIKVEFLLNSQDRLGR